MSAWRSVGVALLLCGCMHDLSRSRPGLDGALGDLARSDGALSPCRTSTDCDDQLPCTDDRCEDGYCLNPLVGDCAAGTPCKNEGQRAAKSDPCRLCTSGKVSDLRPCVRTVAGRCDPTGNGYRNGPAADARFDGPGDLALDGTGNLYVSESVNNVVRQIDTSGVVSTLAGDQKNPGFADGAGGTARFNWPLGLLWTGDRLLVADRKNHRVRAVEGGVVSTVAGDGTPADEAAPEADRLNQPTAITAWGSGFLVSEHPSRVRELVPDGRGGFDVSAGRWAGNPEQTCVAAPGPQADYPLWHLTDVASAGTVVFAVLHNCHAIVRLEGGTASLLAGQPMNPGTQDGDLAAAQLHFPMGVDASDADELVFTSWGGHQVRRVSATTVKTLAGGTDPGTEDGPGALARFNKPTGLVHDPAAHKIYVADSSNHCIRVVLEQ